MLSAAHTIISTTFGVYINNPILIFIIAFIFHIFCDSILHWNIDPEKWNKFPHNWIMLDVISGIVIVWLILGQQIFTLPILAAIAGGNAPDIIHVIWLIAPPHIRKKYPRWAKAFIHLHGKVQNETSNIARGLIWQVVFAAIAIIAITTKIYL